MTIGTFHQLQISSHQMCHGAEAGLRGLGGKGGGEEGPGGCPPRRSPFPRCAVAPFAREPVFPVPFAGLLLVATARVVIEYYKSYGLFLTGVN